MNRKNWFVAIF